MLKVKDNALALRSARASFFAWDLGQKQRKGVVRL